MTIMAKKKKKGRPSLLDLQKRSLKQQQQQQQQLQNQHRQNPNSLNFNSSPNSPPPELVFATGGTNGDDDDDERKEKKQKLVIGFNSNSDGRDGPALSPFDLNADDVDHKRRRNNSAAVAHHGSNQMSEKVLKATDNCSSEHGLQVETGPTTPLPDKKLLVFILDRLQKKDTYGVFSEPVDPEELPDYHEIIANPMDFSTVRKKLDCGVYTNLEQFERDVFLICSNAMEYNAPDTIYFRQARSMHELAKKDFENLRQESEDDEPEPKIVRRGRPPGKKVKKSIESSPVERIGPESFSDATLASGGENANGSTTYNLRKSRNTNMLRPADAVINGVVHRSPGGETCTSWISEWENEFPASILRSVMKYGKKQFAVDENKRNTYRFWSASGYGRSTLAALDEERKRLVEVDDAYLDHSYARSIARFAADLGPVVWKIALKKIESILPVELKFGPEGWTGENEASNNDKLLLCEKVIPDPAANDLTTRLLPQRISASNSVGAEKFFLQGREDIEAIRSLNSQSESTSPNSNVGGIRPVAPFQLQQHSMVQPCISGQNSGLHPYIRPQMGNVNSITLTGESSRAEASVPSQMFGMVSTSSNTASGTPLHLNDIDSNDSNLLITASRADYGNFLPPGSSSLCSFRAPESGFVGEESWKGLAMHHKQDSHHPFPSEPNVEFRAAASSSSVAQIGSPWQPDLALQLRMGR